MKCTPKEIRELTIRIRQGDEQAAMHLCTCFMPEIRFATRYSNRMQSDAIQEVCDVLVCKAMAQKSRWMESKSRVDVFL